MFAFGLHTLSSRQISLDNLSEPSAQGATLEPATGGCKVGFTKYVSSSASILLLFLYRPSPMHNSSTDDTLNSTIAKRSDHKLKLRN